MFIKCSSAKTMCCARAQIQAPTSRYWNLMSDWRTDDFLSCSEERFFWISWNGGHISVGRGQVVGHHMIIAFQAISGYPIKALSFSTDGSTGEWRFPLANGLLL